MSAGCLECKGTGLIGKDQQTSHVCTNCAGTGVVESAPEAPVSAPEEPEKKSEESSPESSVSE